MATPPLANIDLLKVAEAYKRKGSHGWRLVPGVHSRTFDSRVQRAIEAGFVTREQRRTVDEKTPMPTDAELSAWLRENGHEAPITPEDAARIGYAPGHWTDGVAPGYHMGKVTVQRANGHVERVWERQIPNPRAAEIEEAIDRRVERITPIEPTPLPDVLGPANILNQVTIADGHVGALAWHKETGSGDWDLTIARDTLLTGACWLMDNLPAADTLLLNILGDFTDTDGYAPLTPASKNLLDVDGRYPKIADVGSEVIESCALHGLKRYRRVILLIRPGNHDPLSSWWMRKLFTRIFEKESRVEVDQSIRPYWAMLFGKTMIAAHHGDKAKLGELPGIFAADFAEQWGKATYRICHTGHMHHKHFIVHSGKEERGMMVYQHPTLAARNAWAADKGLAAARELLGHSYHSNGAMAQTLHFSPEMMA